MDKRELKMRVGHTVYLRPTGNIFQRRKYKPGVVPARVLKVGPKNAYIARVLDGGGLAREEKLKMREWRTTVHLDDGHNGGYQVYRDEAEYEADLERERLATVCASATAAQYLRLPADLLAKVVGALEGTAKL